VDFVRALHPDFWFPNRKPLRPTRVDGLVGPSSVFLCREPAAIDEAGHTLPGTATGVTQVGGAYGAPALSFNGTTSKIVLLNGAGIQDIFVVGTGGTMAFSINPTVNTSGTIFDKSDGNNVDIGWWLDFKAGPILEFKIELSAANYAITVPAPATGVYTRIVIAWDGSTFPATSDTKVWFNGVAQTVTTAGSGNGTHGTDSGQVLTIGNASFGGSGNGFFSGALDGPIIFDRRQWTQADASDDFAEPFRYLSPIPPTPPVETPSGGGSPNVSLTGVAATGAVAGFTPNVQPSLTAVSSTGAAAAFVPNVEPVLGAVSSSGAAAAFTIEGDASPAFVAASAAGAAGTFSVTTGLTVALTAVAATGAAAAFGIEIDIALGAVSATGTAGALIAAASLALGAVAAAGAAAAFTANVQPILGAAVAAGAVAAFTASISGGTVNVALAVVAAIGAAGTFIFGSGAKRAGRYLLRQVGRLK
jgi:hypothetical protein